MTKVRINDLARELEVKSKPILDALEAIGVPVYKPRAGCFLELEESLQDFLRAAGCEGKLTDEQMQEARCLMAAANPGYVGGGREH